MLSVPMLKDQELVGLIVIYRQEVRPFTDKQIELVENFATQAVIAIENARLLNELRQRTDDLCEALEQQTATSEVLRVISSSPGELEPVFQAMLENATRICEAKFGILFLSTGDGFHTAAMHNAPSALVEARRREPLFRPPPTSALGQMAATSARRKLPTCWQSRVISIRSQATRNRRSAAWRTLGPWSPCPCSRTRNWSVRLSSIVRRCARSPTSRSRW